MNSDRIELLKKYILEEPDNPFNRYALAMEYYEREPDTSLRLMEDLLHDHPDYLPTYFKAAHLYWEMENWDEAEATFKKGIELATVQGDKKTLSELRSAYTNFQFEKE